MIGTYHHQPGSPFLFRPRPGLKLLGSSGACVKFEVPPGKGLILMVTPLDPLNILIVLEAWSESENISLVRHPNPSPFGSNWDLAHSLTPIVKRGGPTEYEPAEEVAIVGTSDGTLLLHDISVPGPVTDYVKTHSAFEPISLQEQALRDFVGAALEASIASVPFQFGLNHVINLFSAGISFAQQYPCIVKWALKQEGFHQYPVWYGSQGFMKEKLDTMEAVLKEHADEWVGSRVEGSPLPESVDVPEHLQRQLNDLLRDIEQGEGDDGPVL